MAAPMDTDSPPPPPIKVWIMSMNRHVTTDEIVRGLNKIEEEETRKMCLNKPTRDECIRSMISKLYPIIVIQHKLGRYRFRRAKTGTGKEFFQSDDPNMCLGYSTADTGSLVGMAWATGPMKEVVNIGLDVMKFSIPRNTTVTDFFESVKHKMTEREQIDVCSGRTDESLLRRLLILLTMKTAYIKAIHQPPGFDYRRMDLSLPTSVFKVDGQELRGWEIRLFKSNLGIQRKDVLVEEIYQCCAMIHRPALASQRGTNGTYNKVYWNDKAEEAVEMLNFLKVDQIVKAYDGLVMKNGPPSNNVNGRARTSTSNSSGVPNMHSSSGHAHGSHGNSLSSSTSSSAPHQMHGGHGHGSSHTTITNGITSSMSMTAGGSNPVVVGNAAGLRRMATEQPTRRSSEDPARVHAGLTH